MLTPFQMRARRALVDNPFFGAIADDCLRWVHHTSLRRGELLFEKGEPSDAIFGIVSGQLKLFSTSADGSQISFGIVAPGESVGELGVSDGAPRHMSVVALAHSECVTLRRRDLEPLLARDSALRDRLSLATARAARSLSERIEDAAFLSIEARVEKALADCADRFGERLEGGRTSIRLRQQDLADLLGLSRAAVNRVLTSYATDGRIEIGRGRIIILQGAAPA